MEMVVVMIVAALGGIVAYLNLRGRRQRRLARSGGDTGGAETSGTRTERDALRGDRDPGDGGPDSGGDGGGGD